MGSLPNYKPRFDTEKLESIPIEDVLEKLGAERVGTTKKFHCFNQGAHESSDKSASLVAVPEKNYCNCFGCNMGGGPVALLTAKMGGNFKEACEWLHDTFNIPYLDNSTHAIPTTITEYKPKEIEYLSFDKERPFAAVSLDDWIPHYYKLNDERKLKLVYTAVYRFSLQTDQRQKIAYHAGRGIASDHPMQEKIGYLSPSDLKKLSSYLKQTFPTEDLIRFKLFSSTDHQYYPETWKYWSKEGFCVAPSMDLYSDMCNGFMLRNTDANLNKKSPKEIRIACSSISEALPFGLTRELLLSDKSVPIYANEGYIDGLSLGKEKLFIASTGVHGLKEKIFGLLKGREFRLAYDMDNPGLRAMRGYYAVTVKRDPTSTREKVVSKYFLKTTAGKAEKDRYLDRVKSLTNLIPVEKNYPGLIDILPKAGVLPVVVSWETKIDKNKFVTDINEVLKEYKKIYNSDLTGKTVEVAVEDLKSFYKKEGISRPIYLSG